MKFSFFKKTPNLETRKNVKLIRACIVNLSNVDNQTKQITESIMKNGIDIDYYASKDKNCKNNMKNAGTETYVISESNTRNKYSKKYFNCTGIIVVGRNKKSEEISFMSHQDPWKFLEIKNIKTKFIKDLSKNIKEILQKVEKDSVDAIIFGGNDGYLEYKNSIKLINQVLKKELGFEPTVMTGPNLVKGQTDVFFDTKNRRLYIIRNEQCDKYETNEHYLPSELEEKSKSWKV